MPDRPNIFLPRAHVCEACGHISTRPARAPPARVFIVRRDDAPATLAAFANVNHAYLYGIRCTLTLVEQLAEAIVPELRAHAVDRALGTPRKRLKAIEASLDAAGIECARFTVERLEISAADPEQEQEEEEDDDDDDDASGLLEKKESCSDTGSYDTRTTSVSSACKTPATSGGFGRLPPEFSTAAYGGDFPSKDFTTYSHHSPPRSQQDGQQQHASRSFAPADSSSSAATSRNNNNNAETAFSLPFQTAYSALDFGMPGDDYSPTDNGAYFGFRPIADCAGEMGFDSYVDDETSLWRDRPNYYYASSSSSSSFFPREAGAASSSPSYGTDTAAAADGGGGGAGAGYGFAVSDLADATASLSLLRSMGHDVSDPTAIGFWTPGLPYIPPYPTTTGHDDDDDDDRNEKRTEE
ncbi:hypothetical protein HDU87_001703 [Geranomyces variabilis]|uniref:Uncharacterized protein n=1 Tax=Geranomyces variabilis TaxID=109894 RepID=A0AAD5TC74_9FUNG|nr:hypothetical protein HDU87_001703 [Geranomyces variabilis]